jgi:hypothetical protein
MSEDFPTMIRDILSKEERKEKRKQLYYEVQEFSDLIDNILSVQSLLFKLSKILYSNPDQVISIPATEGKNYPFNKNDLRSSEKVLQRSIKELKAIFKASKHKRRDISPDSLVGVYSPVFCGEALKFFFNEKAAGFGRRNPETSPTGELLMDALSFVKQGLILRNGILPLAYDYFRVNGLQGDSSAGRGQFIVSDDHMKKAFDDPSRPADFYSYSPEGSTKKDRIPMQLAIDKGIVDHALTPYEALQLQHPYKDSHGNVIMTDSSARTNRKGETKVTQGRQSGFSPGQFPSQFVTSLVSQCFFSAKDVRKMLEITTQDSPDYAVWTQILELLQDKDTCDSLIKEHEVILETKREYEHLKSTEKKTGGRKGMQGRKAGPTQAAVAGKLTAQQQQQGVRAPVGGARR